MTPALFGKKGKIGHFAVLGDNAGNAPTDYICGMGLKKD